MRDRAKTGIGHGVGRVAVGMAVTLLLVASGCTIVPEPLGLEAQAARAAVDRARLDDLQEPLTGPVTLAEAIARALKYNLDHRVMVMEQALRSHQLDLARYDLLPRLAADAGLTTRSNENLTLSRNTVTGARSTDPSVSQDRTRGTVDLGLSWNVLDFGVSYYQARQEADRVFVAAEQRRRVAHSLIQQVTSAWWRAATAERLRGEVAFLLDEAKRALADAEEVEAQRLRPMAEMLRYQRALLDVIQRLEILDREFAIAKTQLAALMSLPVGTRYEIAVPEDLPPQPDLQLDVEQMEVLALVNRPELREQTYQARINRLEARKALLRMLPGLTLTSSLNYDSNSYLVNQEWAEAGLRVTWNLLTLVSGPKSVRLAEAQAELGELRRQALSVAVLTQVHVAWQQYRRAREEYEQAIKVYNVEQRLYELTQQAASARAENSLERVRSAATALLSELARDEAYVAVQNAAASLIVSLGLDPLPATVVDHDIATLSSAIAVAQADWAAGRITVPKLPEPVEAGARMADVLPPLEVAP